MKRLSFFTAIGVLLMLFHPSSAAATTYTWLGLTTSWNNPFNWLPTGTPSMGDDVNIGVSSVLYVSYPTVVANTTVNSITFGPTLLSSQIILFVTGGAALTVTSAMTVNTGSVVNIQESGTTGTASVNIAPGSQLNVNGTGTLTITAPALLTLQSTATGDAAVGPLATGAITGIVNVERFLKGGTVSERDYRLMSSPVYVTASSPHAYNLDYIQATAVVTGAAGGGFDKTGNPTLYLFNEVLPLSNAYFGAGSWPGISKINNSPTYNLAVNGTGPYNLAPGAGFLFFFRGDRTAASITAETTVGYVPMPATFTAKGALNIGPVAAPVWYNGNATFLGYSGTGTGGNAGVRGFNLVGNPYACAISWDKFQISNPTSGIYGVNIKGSMTAGTGTMWVLDPVSRTYGSYTSGNAGVGSQAFVSKFISSGQGFFVQATMTGGQLTFNESAKSVSAQNTGSQLLMSDQPVSVVQPQYLRLQFFKDSVNSEQTTIRFISEGATDTTIYNEAHFEGFGGVSFYSLSGNNEDLGIYTAKLPGKQNTVIRLYINATTSGTYQVKLRNLVAIPELYDIWLMDAYKKDSLNLRSGIYSLDISKTDSASFGGNRLSLVIRQNPAIAYRLLDFTAGKTQTYSNVEVRWKTEYEENSTDFTVERSTNNCKTFDMLGSIKSNGSGSYSFVDKNPDNGRNLYRLKQQDINDSVTYSKVVDVQFGDLFSKLHIFPNPATHTINLAIAQQNYYGGHYSIKFMNSAGRVVKEVESSQPEWQGNISYLMPGTYLVRVVNNKTQNLVGENKFVKL